MPMLVDSCSNLYFILLTLWDFVNCKCRIYLSYQGKQYRSVFKKLSPWTSSEVTLEKPALRAWCVYACTHTHIFSAVKCSTTELYPLFWVYLSLSFLKMFKQIFICMSISPLPPFLLNKQTNKKHKWDKATVKNPDNQIISREENGMVGTEVEGRSTFDYVPFCTAFFFPLFSFHLGYVLSIKIKSLHHR